MVDHFIWTCPIFWLHFVHSKGIQVSLSHARKLLLTGQPQVSQQHPGPLSCSFPCLFLFWDERQQVTGLPATTNDTKGSWTISEVPYSLASLTHSKSEIHEQPSVFSKHQKAIEKPNALFLPGGIPDVCQECLILVSLHFLIKPEHLKYI